MVSFDYGAADEAATQLLVTAESLVECLSVLATDREIVTDGWQGPFRTSFDAEIESTLAGGSYLVGMLQQMAAVVRARAWEAEAAQAAEDRAREAELAECQGGDGCGAQPHGN